jgi:sugar lactone lactonase YvrE
VDERRQPLQPPAPAAILILAPTAKHLGTINTGEATANCGWGGDGSDLYITATCTCAG